MIDVNYENFIKLLSENTSIKKIKQSNVNLENGIKKIKNGGHIYIWPSAKIGRRIYRELKDHEYKNITLVDSNSELHGTTSPNDITFNDEDVLIIATLTYSNDIFHLAEKMNCKNILMYYNIKELDGLNSIVFPQDFYDICFEESSIHLLENVERYKQVYFSLEDDLSKKAFLNNMFFRLTQDIRYTFEMDKGIQYFDNDIVDFSGEDVLIDAGGCDGDTLKEFLELGKSFKSYYLFEPDEDLLKKSKTVTDDERIHYINKGVFSKSGKLRFNKTQDMIGDGYISDEGVDTIDVVSIDECVKEKVSFIKMDIEGSELEALKGAKNTINDNEPTLSICIYHKSTDYLDIFEFIKEINPEYKFFMRHYRNYYAEAVLYAVLRNGEI